MSTIIIPLKHIILDPLNPIDLASIPEQDAMELIRKSYGFLSPAIQVSIADGIAIIQLEEARGERIGEALKQYQKAVREAQQGNYQKAVTLFVKVLDVIPQNVDARRNLAMAYMEMGDHQQARKLLEECLKIDPTNAWSFVLLGNIATKHERSPEVAAFYYETGLSINPNDNLLLNNFAALRLEQGRPAQARELFERALAIDPSYPNTSYGLALLHKLTSSPELALKVLEQLFKQPASEDIRTAPVYKNARELYLDISTELAKKESLALMKTILSRKNAIEIATGYPISIEEDNSLEYVSAVAQMAWKHGRDEHRVRYRMRSEAMAPHLIAHELEHIIIENEARQIGRNRTFTSTATTREHAVRSIESHITKLQRQGYPESKISDIMLKLIHGLNNQVFNCPLDMVVEHNIHNKYPDLRHAQFASLHQMYLEALQTYTNPEIKKLTPPSIFRASLTLNCAYALFIDHLYQGVTDYAAAYRSSEHFSTGKNLFDIWKKRMESFTPGDEYDVVDEYARQLKLLSWYDWQPDRTPLRTGLEPQKSASPIPLTTDKPEAYTFCLDAMRRFDGQSRDRIFAAISEISILGMNGIDHTTPGKTFTLKSYPGETFSGLHLLCLMYVGFKLYDPKVDCGLDFAEAYELAQESRSAVLH
jgi:tetratricopeptide (TPR) repeat protein